MKEIAGGSYLIKGTLANGNKFRPSDWAERLAGSTNICIEGGERGPNKEVCVTVACVDGVPALLIPKGLEQASPQALEFALNFARSNSLRIEELPESAKPQEGACRKAPGAR